MGTAAALPTLRLGDVEIKRLMRGETPLDGPPEGGPSPPGTPPPTTSPPLLLDLPDSVVVGSRLTGRRKVGERGGVRLMPPQLE